MKTKSNIKFFAISIALLLGIFITSCSKEDSLLISENETTDLLLKSASSAVDITECELTAGQHLNAGKVIYSHDDDNMYVTYITSGAWYLTELHTYVGNLDGIPRNKTAIQIGKFPYSISNLNNATTWTFTIPLAGLTKDENGYTIAAHAVVNNGTQEETAWANCTYQPVLTVKLKFTNGEFAASEGDWFLTSGAWCTYLGVNTYEKGDNDEYPLVSNYWRAGGLGKVTVNYIEPNVEVTVIPAEGLSLKETFVYFGDRQGLQNLVDGLCPDYTKFPYISKTTPASTHSFIIPYKDSHSLSFKTAFGSNRWGWISYYKL